ncbi:MAG: hypothetical protein DI534_14895 [Leifsonia xyli]|nr:MAG: hypothetical protein DI534_14895 [Leifsonia xyli]
MPRIQGVFHGLFISFNKAFVRSVKNSRNRCFEQSLVVLLWLVQGKLGQRMAESAHYIALLPLSELIADSHVELRLQLYGKRTLL